MGNDHSKVVINDETFGKDGHFKAHIKLYDGMDRSERIKLREACQAWISVWQTREFKEWVLSFPFQDTELSNEQIYEKLIGSSSHAINVIDSDAEIEIWVNHSSSGNELHTVFSHDGKQWAGSKYLMTYSAAKLAGHLAHDYCRHLNFLHINNTAERSVPFAVGKKTKRMAEAASYAFAEATSAKYFD